MSPSSGTATCAGYVTTLSLEDVEGDIVNGAVDALDDVDLRVSKMKIKMITTMIAMVTP
jgi:hypothetical protein